jgi:hypothetical protein
MNQSAFQIEGITEPNHDGRNVHIYMPWMFDAGMAAVMSMAQAVNNGTSWFGHQTQKANVVVLSDQVWLDKQLRTIARNVGARWYPTQVNLGYRHIANEVARVAAETIELCPPDDPLVVFEIDWIGMRGGYLPEEPDRVAFEFNSQDIDTHGHFAQYFGQVSVVSLVQESTLHLEHEWCRGIGPGYPSASPLRVGGGPSGGIYNKPFAVQRLSESGVWRDVTERRVFKHDVFEVPKSIDPKAPPREPIVFEMPVEPPR